MESRKFKPDENLIFHLIQSQSSTLQSAMRELVQNAYDADATACYIELDHAGFTVKDDGRGFADRAEIERCFETFGTPHEQDREQYFGRFRMGRCQIMAFAPTNWESNQFRMEVDFKGRGLEYTLEENCPPYPGCSIQGKWYSAPDVRELRELMNDLKTYFEFFYRMPVWVNGVRLSKSLEELTIAAESDDCLVIQDNGRPQVTIYNLGMFVSTFHPDYQPWQLTGAIITKNHLQLDISRQRIDPECPVWQRISKFLRQNFARAKRKGNLSKAQIYGYLNEVYAGTIQVSELRSLKIFQDPSSTKKYSLEDLAQCKSFTFAFCKEHDLLADKISQAGNTLVLSLRHIVEVTRAATYGDAIYGFLDALDALELGDEFVTEDDMLFIEQIISKYEPFDEASENYEEEFGFLNEDELTIQEQCAFKAIRAAQVKMVYKRILSRSYREDEWMNVRRRTLRVGVSPTFDGWTDGHSFIAINRTLLKRVAQGMLKSDYVAAVLVHEWCHVKGDSGKHDAAFYRRYHDYTCNASIDMLATFASHINREYALFLKKAGLPIPTAVVRYLTGELGQAEKDTGMLKRLKQADKRTAEVKDKLENTQRLLYDTLVYLRNQQVSQMPDNMELLLSSLNKHTHPHFGHYVSVDWDELLKEACPVKTDLDELIFGDFDFWK